MNMKKKILLVDDDSLVLRTLQNLLQRHGFETVCTKSVSDAITSLGSNDFNLIISDIRMPGQDGLDFLKMVRGKNISIPCMFITGYASEHAPIDAIKLGAKDYILKPFNLDEIIESVKKNIE